MTTLSMTHVPSSRVHSTTFDVVEAFALLETSRKMALFDQLMANRMNAYRNTIHALWPQAGDDDIRKLEMVLRHRLDKLQRFS